MAKLVGAMQLIKYLVPGTLEIWLATSKKTETSAKRVSEKETVLFRNS